VSRLRRFLHIERSRAATPDPAPEPDGATTRRIEGLERPAPAAAPPARSGADLDRFAPPPAPSLELAPAAAGERPFTRCLRCGMDHHVAALECSHCGARLDDADCLAFNETLWRERLAEAAREDAASVERQAARAEAEAEAARDRRAAAEGLAREIGDAERRRLDAELGPGGEIARGAQRVLGWLLRGRSGTP
jgi:hypothetical protein